MAKRGEVQQKHMNYFIDVMKQIEWDIHNTMLDRGEIPYMWHEIAQTRGRTAKTRITIRIEEDVVKFFRSMGRGYQERMNDVLRAWMHGRLSKVIRGPESAAIQSELDQKEPRPELGDTDLMDRGLVKRDDGTFFQVDQRRYFNAEEVEQYKDLPFKTRRGEAGG